MKRFLFLSLLFLSLSACKNQDKDQDPGPLGADDIVFGHFYGYCLGERCVEIFKIQDGKLYEDTKDEYPGSREPYSGAFVPRSEADYQKVKEIAVNFPRKLLEESSTVIGSPDVTDGGGIYLEVLAEGKSRFFLIDKFRHNVPEYLHAYLDEVEAGIAQLQ
ncbi:hypothetical protein [Rufibacter immobilis]|uniref:hypothetical protein n=1 Tax=Rufibacter immobilis TaxID=1348778 RepID=UPI0035E49E08